MKKLRLLALGLLSVSVMFLTSCEDDEDPTLGPSLTMQLNGNTTKDVTVSSNENLEFTWVARNGDSKLETFSVSLSGANVVNPLPTSAQGNDFPYDVRNADNENYVDTLSFNSGSNSGNNTTYNFRVVDQRRKRGGSEL
ncbi:MAG: hypothetical protein U5L96_04255 [Owenweeksia sp.]|nr:hypothetical protein [Owenweeksia sp.]